MGGMIPYAQSSEPVDAGLGSGVTITDTGGSGQQRAGQSQVLMGLTTNEWIALSAMLNATVLAGTLLVMLYEM